MTSLLILYPHEFNCYSKFERKVARIVKNLNTFSVVYPCDPNSHIERFFGKNSGATLIETAQWEIPNITHAIVFDDGEVFADRIMLLQEAGIKIREIRISISRVINIKKETQYRDKKSTPDYEYIGRGSYWGNPYSMYDEGEKREEVIRKYEYDFEFDKFPNKKKSEVFKLAGKRLGCFCKPQACHGDVLAKFLNEWDDKR